MDDLQGGNPGQQFLPEMADSGCNGMDICHLEHALTQHNQAGGTILENVADLLDDGGEQTIPELHGPVEELVDVGDHLRQVRHGEVGDEVQDDADCCHAEKQQDAENRQNDIDNDAEPACQSKQIYHQPECFQPAAAGPRMSGVLSAGVLSAGVLGVGLLGVGVVVGVLGVGALGVGVGLLAAGSE